MVPAETEADKKKKAQEARERSKEKKEREAEDRKKVEEKFGEQIFRVFSEMRGKFSYYNPFFLKNQAKINQNARKMPSKFKNRPLKTISSNLKSVSQNP